VDADHLTAVVVGTLGLAGALVEAYRRGGSHREEIEQDLRILAALPTTSPQRQPLLDSIESRIGQTVARAEARRDGFGLALAVTFLGIAVYFVVLAVRTSGWFALAAAPFVLFGIVGTVQDGAKRVRDERGRPIRKA